MAGVWQVAKNIAKALELKEEGNQHFKEGNYQKAMAAYHQVGACTTDTVRGYARARPLQRRPLRVPCFSRVPQIFMYVHGYSSTAGGGGGSAGLPGQTTTPVSAEEMAQIRELKIAHHCNLAVCHMKHGPKFSKAKDNCTKALAIDGNNVKGARALVAGARAHPCRPCGALAAPAGRRRPVDVITCHPTQHSCAAASATRRWAILMRLRRIWSVC